MDMIQFEEAHTQWFRDCAVGEMNCRQQGAGLAYAVCRIDDEYGYKVLSGVFFTADDAFRYACERAQEHASFVSSYSDFLLVEDKESWYDLGASVLDWWYTDFAILEYCGGMPPLRMHLFGKDSEDKFGQGSSVA